MRIHPLAFFFLLNLPSISWADSCNVKFASGAELYRCAISRDPRLTSIELNQLEREGRLKEASQLPNPVAESEIGFDSEGRQTVSLVQPLEIGGKRSARIRVAQAENDLSSVEVEAIRAEAAAELAVSIVKYRQLKDRLSLLAATQKSLATLIKRLRAKAIKTPEERNALSIFTLHSTSLEAQILAAEQDLRSTRTALGAAIGREISESENPGIPEKRDWPRIEPSHIKETFGSRLASASIRRATEEVRLQNSLAWPDFAIGPTYERMRGNEGSVGAKIELVIPLFNLNGGARQRSRAGQLRTEALARRVQLQEAQVLGGLLQQYNDLTAFLKSGPSQASVVTSTSESIQLFSRALLQPSSIVESFRSALETLEAIQETESTVYRIYWQLRSYSGDFPKEFP